MFVTSAELSWVLTQCLDQPRVAEKPGKSPIPLKEVEIWTNHLKPLPGAFTIKPQIVKTPSRCVCTGKGFWRFVKAGNTEKKASENPFWVQNLQKTTPKWPPKHAWRMGNGPQIGFSICDHFSWALGHFPRQTRLKWAKNFKARFLSLTKCTEKGFWLFVPDMTF